MAVIIITCILKHVLAVNGKDEAADYRCDTLAVKEIPDIYGSI